MVTSEDDGMVHLSSPYWVPETLKRLDSILQLRGHTVFARIAILRVVVVFGIGYR
jgi:hypothetical protein